MTGITDFRSDRDFGPPIAPSQNAGVRGAPILQNLPLVVVLLTPMEPGYSTLRLYLSATPRRGVISCSRDGNGQGCEVLQGAVRSPVAGASGSGFHCRETAQAIPSFGAA